jgi:dynactin complex subunit
MNDPVASLSALLSNVILPNLQSVQRSQAEQIAANDSLEQSIEELRLHLESQFAHLNAQLTACRAELAATQALLIAAQAHGGIRSLDRMPLIH